jgi:hypothetical protein
MQHTGCSVCAGRFESFVEGNNKNKNQQATPLKVGQIKRWKYLLYLCFPWGHFPLLELRRFEELND